MKLVFTTVSLFLLTFQLQAQFKNVLIDSGSIGNWRPCEPSIAISKKKPKVLVAGSIMNNAHYSNNRGKTWQTVPMESTFGIWGDPVLISDMKGDFYYFHLSDPSGKNWDSDEILDRIVCQKSTDQGQSWSNGSYMGLNPPSDQDKEWAVVNPANNHIYATWTEFDQYGNKDSTCYSHILFSKSIDAGANWSTPVYLNNIKGNCVDDGSTVEGAVPTAGIDNKVYVAWSLNEKIYFSKSNDEGATWSKNAQKAANQIGGWDLVIPGINRSNGMPITVCDLSKQKTRGTIYINYADQSNGKEDTDIWLIKSTNDGTTWSTPKRVNNDPIGNKKHQFLTWMTIDQKTGFLYFVFYDRRNYQNEQTDVYLAYSQDGGETFENIKISEEPFTPNPAYFFGDYNNIDVHKGYIHPIWTRMEAGKTSIWTTTIKQKKLFKLKTYK